jgi:hypothetical protein
MEDDFPVANGSLRLVDAWIAKPPLPGEARLDGHIRPLGIAHIVLVGLLPNKGPRLPEQLHRPFPCGKPFEPGKFRAGELIQDPVGLEHVDHLQAMALADFKVRLVVGGRDLQRSRAEFAVDAGIGYDRDRRPVQGPEHGPANHPRITGIVGMHGYGDVRRYRLRPGRGNVNEFSRAVGELIAHFPEEAVDRLHDDLLVRERCLGSRAPIDHALAAIDAALLEKPAESGQHGPRIRRIHGEVGPVPVAGAAQSPELLQDLPTLFPAPIPYPFEEFLAAEVAAGLLLLSELPFDHSLGGDSGVVGAGDPDGRKAAPCRVGLQPGAPH